MFLVLLVLILLLVFIKTKRNCCAFPIYPGALPIIGNAHTLLGDSVNLVNVIKDVSCKLMENKGYLACLLGPFKCLYVIGDPDDCALALNVCLDKHYVYSFGNAWVGDGIVSANAQTWKKNRKLLHPMFSLPRVRNFLPVFNKQARRLVERFAEHEGKGAFNLEHHISIVFLETVYQTVLGSDVTDYLSTNKRVSESQNLLLRIFVTRFKWIWLHNNFIFNWTSLRRIQDESIKVINKMSNELLQKRKLLCNFATENIDEEKEIIEPFVDEIIKVSEKGGFTDEKIIHEINTLVAAGYDTTANAFINCLMLLGHHQDIQAKVYKELTDIFDVSDRDVNKDDIVKLVYLEAVIKESLRVIPLFPFVGRHTNEELKLKKYTIPAGSDFFVCLYALSRHPMWGPDVEQFRPERWLDGTAPSNPNLFAAFGLGKRSCIGKTYNFLSFMTKMSHVIRRFHVSADISKLVLKMDVLLKPHSGQNIILEPRINLTNY